MPYLSQNSDGEAGHSDAPTSDHDHDQNDVESSLSAESGSGAAALSDSHDDHDDSGLGPVSESNGDDGSSESASPSDDDQGRGSHGRFFDLEASESHDGDDSEEDKDYDDDTDDEGSYLDSFPQFSRLPAELRRMIWEAFCPDLTSTQGRVYDIASPTFPRYEELTMDINVTLPQRTQQARTVLAVHRQSRSWALKSFPDELPLPFGHSTDILRFDKQKDIIIFDRTRKLHLGNFFLHQIHNLAVHAHHYTYYDDLPPPGSDLLPNLKQLFFVVSGNECQPEMSFSWCATKDTILTTPTTFIEKLDRHKFTHTYQYCWPDVKKWPNFSGHETELHELWRVGEVPPPYDVGGTGDDHVDDDSDSDSDEESDAEIDERVRRMVRNQMSKLPIYPLVEFENDLDLVEKIQAWNGDPDDWNPAWGGDYTDDEDLTPEEYASSGIDDSEIEEDQGDDDDDDDLIVVDDSDDQGSDSEAEGVSTDEFPQQFGPAHFSSADDESATVRGDSSASDANEPGTQTRRAIPGRSRSRFVESDSDSDEVQASRPRGHSANKTVITIDDSSDEDDSPARSSKKQSRRAKKASSSSESSSDDNANKAPRERKRKRKILDDSSSSSEDDAPTQQSRQSRPTKEPSPSSDDAVPDQRSRKRRIVSDDSDSDSDDPAPRKRVRQSKNRVESDSEDVTDHNPDEMDTSDEDSSPNEKTTKRRRNDKRQPTDSDSDSSSSSGSPSESDARPLSLAERLALNRRENPIPESDDDLESDEEGDEENHDGGALGEYAYNGEFQDDDDDEGDESEAHEGGFLDEDGDGDEEGY